MLLEPYLNRKVTVGDRTRYRRVRKGLSRDSGESRVRVVLFGLNRKHSTTMLKHHRDNP